MQNFDDNKLLAEINQGSHKAFGVLVNRYSKYFYAIAYRYTANKTSAEDITQQAMLKLWEFPYKYDAKKETSFKTWFTRVIINMCIDYKRKNRQIFEDIDDMQIGTTEKNQAEKLYEKQMKIVLEAAINKLPTAQQTAINLGFYQEIPYGEVAEIMKTSASAVKSLIMRAKENIKKYMKEQGHEN